MIPLPPVEWLITPESIVLVIASAIAGLISLLLVVRTGFVLVRWLVSKLAPVARDVAPIAGAFGAVSREVRYLRRRR